MLKKTVSLEDLRSYILCVLWQCAPSGKTFGKYKMGESDLCDAFYLRIAIFISRLVWTATEQCLKVLSSLFFALQFPHQITT